jgi:hypothetical protein
MTTKKRDQMNTAKNSVEIAAEALKAAIPKPERRTEQVLLALTPSEKARLVAYAAEADEPPAASARNLLIAALTTLGK